MIIRLFFIIFLLVFHPIHLTVVNLEYNNKQKAFIMRVRFFTDDFQKILYIKYGQKVHFNQQNDLTKQLIHKYITDRFKISVNNQLINKNKFQIKRYWTEDITIWVDLKIPYRGKVAQIEIENRLMTDLYSDQSNLLIFTINNQQKAFKFTRKHIKESIIL